jgi:predicted transcriptional regulator
MGALEAEVLGVLWDQDRPLTPGEVAEALHTDLAYTTVMTILARLWKKGLAERHRQGRAFAYTAVLSEADLAAKRMHDTLDRTTDQAAVLSRFVEGLSPAEVRRLRKLLNDGSK